MSSDLTIEFDTKVYELFKSPVVFFEINCCSEIRFIRAWFVSFSSVTVLTKGQRRLRRGEFRAQGPSLAFSSETGVTGVSDEIALRTRSLPLSYSFFQGPFITRNCAGLARISLMGRSVPRKKPRYYSHAIGSDRVF